MEVAKKGVEDRRIKLGCVQPGETSATFGDALRKLVEYNRPTYTLMAVATGYSTQASISRWLRSARVRCRFMTCMKRRGFTCRSRRRSEGDFSERKACPPNFSECLMNPKRD